ncbi:UDP-glycosyltransferase 87A1-like isoform X2 [Lotus japonicus]|uniref:UDP-glycosyltransferase 87A1-like isoform X2 n=1 Tax=Lotus japonicus TaxID=34305 RepID=UPI0025891482|nr:UDP-glycosyltransferase 87A1-like isoform X2 [Lotus japonicus]
MEAPPPPPPSLPCHVVALPYHARGHINPMMNQCKLLVSKNNNILVTLVVTEEWLSFIGSDAKPDNIKIRSIPNVIPSELTRGYDLPAFMEAVMTKMEHPFEEVLNNLDPPPSIIVSDTFLYWVIGVGIRRNIPVASFWTMSASAFSMFLHYHLLEKNGHYLVNLSENGEKLMDYIPGVSPTRVADFPLNDDSYRSKGVLKQCLKGFSWVHKAQYLLFPSIYELEPEAIDVLKAKLSMPIYTIGPATPHFTLEKSPTSSTEGNKMKNVCKENIIEGNNTPSHSYLEWLDAQPAGSVLYISQGSFYSVSRAQIDEIALALRESKVRFLWVARGEAQRLSEICGDIINKDTAGLVLEWCDQWRVLCHAAVGGFWTHCGWNSTKEGVLAGVPFLTFPIFIDQPLDSNSKMIVEDWKVGWRVKESVEVNGFVKKDEIVRLVKRFMDLDSDFAGEIRERAKKLQFICHRAIEIGGFADSDLNAFISTIMQVA